LMERVSMAVLMAAVVVWAVVRAVMVRVAV
jgi:hypothetical protein